MRSRTSIAVIAILVFPCCALAQAPEPYNILFLLADDMRADAIGAWGNANIDTPNVDRLVRAGFSFRRNYCMGSPHGAVCVPSRAMLLSGKSYLRIPLDLEGVETYPERLDESGYTTFITGKWHNEPPSLARSFDTGRAIMVGGMSSHDAVPLVDLTADDRLVNERVGDEPSSALFADAAIDFIAHHDEAAPFLAYVAFTAPHDPRMAPTDYLDRYYARRPPLPENFLPQHPFDNGRLITRDENLAPWPRTEDVIREQLAEYYALITFMDAQIGRILEALDNSPHAENTIVVFAADQGIALGSHGLLGKQNVYEHSMRAPMVFAGPGIPHGESHVLTYLLDAFPTIFDVLGLNLTESLDGRSLVPIWRDHAAGVRDAIFLAYEDVQRAVVTDRYKLILYPKIDYVQLFDLDSDPNEIHNLADNAANSAQVAQLLDELKRLAERYGDTAPLSAPNPAPKEIDLTDTPREPDQWQPDWIVKKYFSSKP